VGDRSIASLVSTAEIGGTEVVLLDMIAALRAARPSWTHTAVVPADGPLVARLDALGVAPRVVPFPPALERLGEAGGVAAPGSGPSWLRLLLRNGPAGAAALGYSRRLRRVLREMRPDVVHANGFKMQLLSAMARPPGAAEVWHVHDYVAHRPLTVTLLRRACRRCHLAIANSESVARDLRDALGDRVRVVRMYNGVDLSRFTPAGDRQDLDALASLSPAPAGTLRVGLVATFARWKGHRVFLEALSLLPRALPLRAYVVGGAHYRTDDSQVSLQELVDAAGRLGVGDRVGFTGPVDDVPGVLRALDVVVHASTEPEPFGMVIAEAMACGRPLIVSAAGGAAELYREGADALGNAPGDAAGLARRIGRLAGDAGLRARLSRAARVTAEQLFDRDRLAGDLSAAYDAARRRAAPSRC